MRCSAYSPLTAVLVLALCAACAGDTESGAESGAASDNTATQAAPEGTASVSGTVRFNGPPPARTAINQDRECSELNDDPVQSQAVVVNDDGTLRHVFVYVKEGLGDQTYPVPDEPVVLDQEGCMYVPHVFGVQVGQTIQIENSDPLLHNIHAMPQTNRPFNFGMPTQNSVREQSFRQPEVMVRIKCDVHPWMLAYAGVVTHPFHSVTGENGSFSLENLPAGEYVIEAWHETHGTATQTVTVGDGESAELEFTFGEDGAAA